MKTLEQYYFRLSKKIAQHIVKFRQLLGWKETPFLPEDRTRGEQRAPGLKPLIVWLNVLMRFNQ